MGVQTRSMDFPCGTCTTCGTGALGFLAGAAALLLAGGRRGGAGSRLAHRLHLDGVHLQTTVLEALVDCRMC